MKKIFLFLFILSLNQIFSQEYLLIDNETKEKVSFATVKYLDNGSYSNNEGYVKLKDIKKGDTVFIEHLGYERVSLSYPFKKDTIFLKPKVNEIDFVKIINKKTRKKITAEYLREPKIFGSWHLTPKQEILIHVKPNEKTENSYIEIIGFAFAEIDKRIEKYVEKNYDTEVSNYNVLLRVNIYNIKNNGQISDIIYSSRAIKKQSNKTSSLDINISNENIILNEKGLFIGLELIGNLSNLNGMSRIRPSLTKKSSKYFYSKTYIKNVFENNKIKPISDLLEVNGKKYDRNLRIYLKLLAPNN